MTESARDAALHDNNFLNCRICVLHDSELDKTRTKKILKLFDKTIEDCKTTHIVVQDINPWIMMINEDVFVIYFGEDKPVIKLADVSNWTQDFYKWTGIAWTAVCRPVQYAYVTVDEEDKMFIFYDNTYHFEHHVGVDKVNNQYITQYDYTAETYERLMNEKIIQDKKDLLELAELRNDLERRRHTAGYCSVCGTNNAMYTVNPYVAEVKGDYTYRWLCKTCYNNMLAQLIRHNDHT